MIDRVRRYLVRRRKIDLSSGFDPNDVKQALDTQVRLITGRVPPEVMAKVLMIRQIILGILPRSGNLPPGSPQLFIIERTATDYLPTSLQGLPESAQGICDPAPGAGWQDGQRAPVGSADPAGDQDERGRGRCAPQRLGSTAGPWAIPRRALRPRAGPSIGPGSHHRLTVGRFRIARGQRLSVGVRGTVLAAPVLPGQQLAGKIETRRAL